MSSELKPGDRVYYVASADHWHEEDRMGGDLVFLFAHVKDGPLAPDGSRRWKAGDPVEGMHRLVTGSQVRSDGLIETANGLLVRPASPRHPWPAVVNLEIIRTPRRTKALVEGVELVVIVHDETSRLVLDVTHPDGVVTMHLPLALVPHDPAGKQLHSWHRPEEAQP